MDSTSLGQQIGGQVDPTLLVGTFQSQVQLFSSIFVLMLTALAGLLVWISERKTTLAPSRFWSFGGLLAISYGPPASALILGLAVSLSIMQGLLVEISASSDGARIVRSRCDAS